VKYTPLSAINLAATYENGWRRFMRTVAVTCENGWRRLMRMGGGIDENIHLNTKALLYLCLEQQMEINSLKVLVARSNEKRKK
jgi:hypothetical protein